MKVRRSQVIVKVNEEKRVVKSPVLRPGIRDRQGTIIEADVIEQACHDFNRRLNKAKEDQGTGAKLMHTGKHNDGVFHNGLEIVESYITTQDETFKVVQAGGDDIDLRVPAGSWMMAMHIADDEIWMSVKGGLYRGFSIGGLADVVPDLPNEEAA